MAADRPELGVRLAHAYHSTDLTHRPGNCDADKLAAVGMATMRAPIAAELMRVRFDNDAKAFRTALDLLAAWTWRRALALDWRCKHGHCALLARSVLEWWHAPQCRRCGGLGFAKRAGAPLLEARPCTTCRGTGFHPIRLPRALPHATWIARWNDVFGYVSNAEATGTVAVRAKLRNPPPRLQFSGGYGEPLAQNARLVYAPARRAE